MDLLKKIKAWFVGLLYLFKKEDAPPCWEAQHAVKRRLYMVYSGAFYINEKAVSAFNRLVDTYDLDKKLNGITMLGADQKIYLYKKEYDYLSLLINRNEGKILSEEEVSELNEIIENGKKEEWYELFFNEICDEKQPCL